MQQIKLTIMQKIILIVILTIISYSCSKPGYRIDVKIDGIPNGRKVLLKKQENRKIINVDSTTVQNGKFSFNGEIKEPVIFGIFIDSIKNIGIMPFVNVNSKISIIAYKDSLNKSKITGSKLNDELVRLRDGRAIISEKSQGYIQEYQEARKANDTATINRINSEMRTIYNKVAANDWNYVKNNPNSYVTPMVFGNVMTNPIYKDSIKDVFEGFSDEIKNSELAKPIREYFDYLEKQKNIPPMPKAISAPNGNSK